MNTGISFTKRIKNLESKIGQAAGLPPVAMEDDEGIYHVPGHESMTREEFDKLVEPWDKIGLPAIVICRHKGSDC